MSRRLLHTRGRAVLRCAPGMVPIEHAEELGNAIIAAGRGRSPGAMPEWYADFEKQYNARAWRKDDEADSQN